MVFDFVIFDVQRVNVICNLSFTPPVRNVLRKVVTHSRYEKPIHTPDNSKKN